MYSEFYPEELENCHCGKNHVFPLKEILSGKGALRALPEILVNCGVKNPFVVADVNTFRAAADGVLTMLKAKGFSCNKFIFESDRLEPDEKAVDAVFKAFDDSCDSVIGVGSGVINDICKILSHKKSRLYIIVATAPSMDGYASATSSMTVSGLKTSVPSKCPEIIIGDTDILKNAPIKMLRAGLGDMLAKYVSIAEWRISHEINGEYYCENVAKLIRRARDKCVENAAGLVKREDGAVKAVFDGLVVGGIAMAYAGVSRPASGVEHYISHVIDMRGAQFDTATELHGIQCAISTLLTVRLYEKLKTLSLSDEKGEQETSRFDRKEWEKNLRVFLGGAAEPMIALEEKENKYDFEKAKSRRKIIIGKWAKLKEIIDEEMPAAETVSDILKAVGLPLNFKDAGIRIDMKKAFAATKDIRDKYVLSSLLWDIGYLPEFCAAL